MSFYSCKMPDVPGNMGVVMISLVGEELMWKCGNFGVKMVLLMIKFN